MESKTNTKSLQAQVEELERKADVLDSALLAPSLKSETYRKKAAELRATEARS